MNSIYTNHTMKRVDKSSVNYKQNFLFERSGKCRNFVCRVKKTLSSLNFYNLYQNRQKRGCVGPRKGRGLPILF